MDGEWPRRCGAADRLEQRHHPREPPGRAPVPRERRRQRRKAARCMDEQLPLHRLALELEPGARLRDHRPRGDPRGPGRRDRAYLRGHHDAGYELPRRNARDGVGPEERHRHPAHRRGDRPRAGAAPIGGGRDPDRTGPSGPRPAECAQPDHRGGHRQSDHLHEPLRAPPLQGRRPDRAREPARPRERRALHVVPRAAAARPVIGEARRDRVDRPEDGRAARDGGQCDRDPRQPRCGHRDRFGHAGRRSAT